MSRNRTIVLGLSMLFRNALPFLDLFLLYWAIEEANMEPKDFHKLDSVFILGAFVYSFLSSGIIGLFPFVFIFSLIIGNSLRTVVPKSQMYIHIVVTLQAALIILLEKSFTTIITISEIIIDKETITRAVITIFSFVIINFILQKKRKLI